MNGCGVLSRVKCEAASVDINLHRVQAEMTLLYTGTLETPQAHKRSASQFSPPPARHLQCVMKALKDESIF